MTEAKQEGARGVVSAKAQEHRGILAGIGCYLLWGVIPLYWKLLDQVNPFEIVAHRVIWCFIFTALVCRIAKLDFTHLFREKRARRFLIPAAIIITINWTLYIYAVSIDHIVETAIGYYINPIVTIVLGLVVFKERMPLLQWIAVGLCCVGIGFFTVNYGQFPWISLALAISFGVYGAIKKRGGYPATETIAVESAYMTPLAIAACIALSFTTGNCGFLGDTQTPAGWATTLLLIGGGFITMVPLVLFAKAANTIPLTLLGFIQYISPTCGLIIGVFVNGEPFTLAHGVCFGCIWCALALVSLNALINSRSGR